jgi:fructose-bisphosphate aldolase class II
MASNFEKALEIGRPPNIKRLFPNSKALIVSGKAIDRGLIAKGEAMTVAASCRNNLVIRGALKAAQRANSAILIEIAKSEGGRDAYCAVNYWNMARQVDALCNEMGITVPVGIHADHYGIKNAGDIERARTEIPTLFEAGMTSIAIDASHMPDDENLLANLALHQYVPEWASLETEVGEIKGTAGLSTADEALFLVRGLNAHGIFPDWIALNNGTSHGLEASETGIQFELTRDIHTAIEPYNLSGAQHGTSGNSTDRLKRIATETPTTKANVATAFQMLSWGLEVNEYGNAIQNADGSFVKRSDAGMSDALWEELLSTAEAQGLTGGNIKKLNLPFENRILSEPQPIRERMTDAVEGFAYHLLADVFNASDSASLSIEAILQAGSHDLGAKGERIEEPAEWTEEKIRVAASKLDSDKGPEGDWDD